MGLGIIIGILAGGLIMLISGPVIGCYNINEETRAIAGQLMMAVGLIVIFQEKRKRTEKTIHNIFFIFGTPFFF